MIILTFLGLATRSIGLLAVAALVGFALFRASASVRRVAWLMGILAVVALPLVWRVAPPATVTVDKIPGFMAAVQRPAVSKVIRDIDEWTTPPRLEEIEVASVIDKAPEPLNPPTKFLWVWAALSALLFLRLISGLVAAGLFVRQAQPFEFAGMQGLASSFGIGRRIRLLVSDKLSVPATAGLIRPAIVLPTSATTWPESRIRMALSHELAHIRQSDWFFFLVAQLACVMYPFNPFIWLAARRFRAESELAADDRALSQGFRASDYAQGLLEIAQNARRGPVAMVAMARTPRVESRLRAIVDGRRRRGGAALITIALGAAAALASCAAIAAFRLGNPSNDGPGQAAMGILPTGVIGWKGPVKVHVVDEDGRPCTGVRLSFNLLGSYWIASATADPQPVTDASGDYSVDPARLRMRSGGVMGPRQVEESALDSVLAYLPGHAITMSDPVKKGDGIVRIRLGRSCSVRMTAFGPDVTPATGVRLIATRLALRHVGDLFIPKDWRDSAFVTTTDSQGVAVFRDIPEGWSISYDVVDDRYLPTPRRQKNPPVLDGMTYPSLRLAAGSTVEGTATLDGKPLAGLRVQANWAGSPACSSGDTDATGHYVLTRVPPGVCDIHYVGYGKPGQSGPNGWVARQRNGVMVGSGQKLTGMDFDFVHGGFIQGKITFENGKPMQLAIFANTPEFVQFNWGGAGNPGDFSATSNLKDGRYEIRVPASHYRVRPGIGFHPPEVEVDVFDGQAAQADFKIDLKAEEQPIGARHR